MVQLRQPNGSLCSYDSRHSSLYRPINRQCRVSYVADGLDLGIKAQGAILYRQHEHPSARTFLNRLDVSRPGPAVGVLVVIPCFPPVSLGLKCFGYMGGRISIEFCELLVRRPLTFNLAD